MLEPMANRYLEGLSAPRRVRRGRALGFVWLTVVLLMAAMWALLRAPGPDWHLAGVFVGLGLAFAALGARGGAFSRGAARRTVADVQAAELLLLRGRVEPAVQACRALLTRPLSGYVRGQVLLLLGRAAEVAAAFTEAAEIYGLAWNEIQEAPVGNIFKAQLLPVIAARRAFALAADGRLDVATETLRATKHRDALPATAVLESRAELLIDARRGDAPAVLARLDGNRVLHRNGFSHRDRVLAHVLEVMARAKLSGASRGAAVVGADPALRGWVLRAVPEAAAVMGVDS